MYNDEQQETAIQWLSCEEKVGFVCKWTRPVKRKYCIYSLVDNSLLTNNCIIFTRTWMKIKIRQPALMQELEVFIANQELTI